MVSEKLLECAFLIPLVRDSDRVRHSPLAWRELEDDLRDFLNAFSGPERWRLLRDRETIAGEWEGVRDESRKYVVAVSESRLDELRRLLVEQCVRFDQRAIYLSVAGVVEFITPQ